LRRRSWRPQRGEGESCAVPPRSRWLSNPSICDSERGKERKREGERRADAAGASAANSLHLHRLLYTGRGREKEREGRVAAEARTGRWCRDPRTAHQGGGSARSRPNPSSSRRRRKGRGWRPLSCSARKASISFPRSATSLGCGEKREERRGREGNSALRGTILGVAEGAFTAKRCNLALEGFIGHPLRTGGRGEKKKKGSGDLERVNCAFDPTFSLWQPPGRIDHHDENGEGRRTTPAVGRRHAGGGAVLLNASAFTDSSTPSRRRGRRGGGEEGAEETPRPSAFPADRA